MSARWWIVGLALLLFGCNGGEPKVDASSQAAFQNSIAKIRERLPLADQTTFNEAVTVLALRDVGDAIQTGGLLGALAALPSDQNAMFEKVGKALEGKTGAEIVAEAEAIKRDRNKRQVDAVQNEIQALQLELNEADKDQVRVRAMLQAISIKGARFYFSTGDFISEPVIDFTIRNNSSFAIKRVYFHGVLETLGRSIPWVDADFNYEFKGGIEPGETQHLQLSPNMFSDWGNNNLKTRHDLVLTVTVVDLEDAAGKRQLTVAPEQVVQKRQRLADLLEQLKSLGAVP
jgi:hypothetical protein